MKIEIDISGQIQQRNYDSSLGFWRDDAVEKAVCLRSKIKKEIIKKYKGQVTNLIEKLHCILIYYCIKDYLDGVSEIKICKDISPRRLKRLLPLLFKDIKIFHSIKISVREESEPKSKAHRIALKIHRNRRFAYLLITKERIENVLFEFKEE